MTNERNLAIDRFRGALVIMMVIGDYLGGIAFVPDWLKHAPDIGFTIADTVAPAFVFVIGLNFGPSFERRMRDGRLAAYRHFALRYLALIGIGAVISAGATVTGQPTNWGVLQALGVAGLITVIFIRLATWARFVIGAALLIAYQFVLDSALLADVLHSSHGGLFGAVSWAALLILATAVADMWRKGWLPYVLTIVSLAVAGGISTILVPVSKNRISLSFAIITLAMSALVFLIIELVSRADSWRAGLFCWWGQNALALYLLHLLVLSVFVVPPMAWWYLDAPIWLATLQILAILGFMSIIAWWLSRKPRRIFV